MGSPDRQANNGVLLVSGYHGTLRAARRAGPPHDDGASTEELSPMLERMLEPWLAKALDQLNKRTAQGLLIFQGEPIPVHSLLLLLKDRLIGILTQAGGEFCLDQGDGPDLSSANEIVHRFPLLSPLIKSVVAEWATAITIFLQRLHRDKQWIADGLQIADLPPVETISGTASDAHAGGHCVLRVCFRGAGCFYYKPRPVTGEWLWHGLLEGMALLEPELRLPAARVWTDVSRFDYGWAESVFPEESPFASNSTGRAAGRLDYWHAAGAMLCLAQHTRQTDLHLGNIIATASGPAVTDAECFATPSLNVRTDVALSAEKAAIRDAVESMVRTRLLPNGSVNGWPDVSGFFGRAAAAPGVKLPKWEIAPEGRYHLTSIDAELVAHPNVPAQTTVVAVLPQILSGYRHAAELLIRLRKTLISRGTKWRDVLENIHAPRMVVRDTLSYGLLLSRSLEPRHLRSWHRRRNAIVTGLAAGSAVGSPRSLLRAETRALLAMHIPRFVIVPGTGTLASSSWRTLAHDFALSTPAHAVVAQIEALSTEGIENIQVPALLCAVLQAEMTP
ncbi:MAG: DUF4135 domain-containing protein [Acidobacteria bacterium]|nr:DUF4135 domain-containing protein [Acidobacteriota bacterium]MBW4044107.1 DUF4135 domain-containing protein [Acidobacteriota bacterium]